MVRLKPGPNIVSDSPQNTLPLEKDMGSAIYTKDGVVRETLVQSLEAAIDAEDVEGVRALTRDLHESETGDLLEALSEDRRGKFVELSGAGTSKQIGRAHV